MTFDKWRWPVSQGAVNGTRQAHVQGGRRWGPRWLLASRVQLRPVHGAGDPLVVVIDDSVALKRNISENVIFGIFLN